jgi:hypothetical protein
MKEYRNRNYAVNYKSAQSARKTVEEMERVCEVRRGVINYNMKRSQRR